MIGAIEVFALDICVCKHKLSEPVENMMLPTLDHNLASTDLSTVVDILPVSDVIYACFPR